jgi:hypothetical protein
LTTTGRSTLLHRSVADRGHRTAARADPRPERGTPAGASTIELHIDSERAAGYGARVLGLPDMLDLHELGQPPAPHRPWMSAAVTAPVTLAPSEVADLVGRTLRYIASGFGYLDLDPDDETHRAAPLPIARRRAQRIAGRLMVRIRRTRTGLSARS